MLFSCCWDFIRFGWVARVYGLGVSQRETEIIIIQIRLSELNSFNIYLNNSSAFTNDQLVVSSSYS